MSYINEEYLFYLPALIGVLLLLALFGRWRRKRILKGLVADDKKEILLSTSSKTKRMLRSLLFIIAMGFIAYAAARPYKGEDILKRPQQHRDLLVLFDVSKSMNVRDVRGQTRLNYSKWWTRELIERLPAERIGLISFAGTSFLECPLTLDRNTLMTKLGELDSSLLPIGGTNIQQALEKAQDEFQAVPGDHRVIILISDGDEVQGQYQEAVNKLKEEKIPVYVIGIGDPHKPGVVFDADGATQKDSADDLILSQANEGTLQSIARETGGLYVPFDAYNPLNNGLKEVQKKIEASAASKLKEATVRKPKERYVEFLIPAILLLILRLFIGERKANKKVNRVFLTTIILMALSLGVTAEENKIAQLEKQLAEVKDPYKKEVLRFDLVQEYLNKDWAAELKKKGLPPQVQQAKKEEVDYFSKAQGLLEESSESEKRYIKLLALVGMAQTKQEKARKELIQEPDKSLVLFEEVIDHYREAIKLSYLEVDLSIWDKEKREELLERVKAQRPETNPVIDEVISSMNPFAFISPKPESIIENQQQALLDRQRAKWFKEIKEAHKEALEASQKVVIAQDKLSSDPKAEEMRKKQREQMKAKALQEGKEWKEEAREPRVLPAELRTQLSKDHPELSKKLGRLEKALKASVEHPQAKQWLQAPDLARNASQSFFTRNDAVATQFAVQCYQVLGGQWPIPPQDQNQQSQDQNQDQQNKDDQQKQDQQNQDQNKDQKDQQNKDDQKQDKDSQKNDQKDQDNKDKQEQSKKNKQDKDSENKDNQSKQEEGKKDEIDKSNLSDQKREFKDQPKKPKQLSEEELKKKAAEALLRKMEQNNKSLRQLLLEQRRQEAQNKQKLNPKDDR